MCNNMSSAAVLREAVWSRWGKTRGVLGGQPLLHMDVFGELLLTQTQPPYCPSPSPVRMFEGRLTARLPLISAGTKNPAAGGPCPSRTPSAPQKRSRESYC